jgi:hypothetical protein
MSESAIKAALLELIVTSERRDDAIRALEAATRVDLDRGYRLRDPSSAPVQAQNLLLANLQHAVALAHARNVLAIDYDIKHLSQDNVLARVRVAFDKRSTFAPCSKESHAVKRTPCLHCGVRECNGECMGE